MIKKVANELFESVEGFGEDFEKNKKLLKNTMPSKKVRNKVAGGITKLAKKKRQKEHGKQKGRPREQEED